MKKIMNTLLLSCKKASALIIKRNDFGLMRREKVKLFFHLMMCDACHSFAKQNEFINRTLKEEASRSISPSEEVQTPEGLEEQIISKLPL